MEFRLPYMQAMREQAPQMFKDLCRTGELDRFVALKARQASQLFQDLTKAAPKEPDGYPRQPFAREAEEQVRSQLIQFPSEASQQRDEVNALLSRRPLTQAS